MPGVDHHLEHPSTLPGTKTQLPGASVVPRSAARNSPRLPRAWRIRRPSALGRVQSDTGRSHRRGSARTCVRALPFVARRGPQGASGCARGPGRALGRAVAVPRLYYHALAFAGLVVACGGSARPTAPRPAATTLEIEAAPPPALPPDLVLSVVAPAPTPIGHIAWARLPPESFAALARGDARDVDFVA